MVFLSNMHYLVLSKTDMYECEGRSLFIATFLNNQVQSFTSKLQWIPSKYSPFERIHFIVFLFISGKLRRSRPLRYWSTAGPTACLDIYCPREFSSGMETGKGHTHGAKADEEGVCGRIVKPFFSKNVTVSLEVWARALSYKSPSLQTEPEVDFSCSFRTFLLPVVNRVSHSLYYLREMATWTVSPRLLKKIVCITFFTLLIHFAIDGLIAFFW